MRKSVSAHDYTDGFVIGKEERIFTLEDDVCW